MLFVNRFVCKLKPILMKEEGRDATVCTLPLEQQVTEILHFIPLISWFTSVFCFFAVFDNATVVRKLKMRMKVMLFLLKYMFVNRLV